MRVEVYNAAAYCLLRYTDAMRGRETAKRTRARKRNHYLRVSDSNNVRALIATRRLCRRL